MTHPRKYTDFITPEARTDLDTLLVPNVSVDDYRSAMYDLGSELGNLLPTPRSERPVLVVSTSEDADFLTAGYLSTLSKRGIPYKVAVFWNHHYALDSGESVAPIVRSYIQDGATSCTEIVLLKSIISGSCVIRTNLLALFASIDTATIESIFVAAPVMHEQGEERLKAEFPEDICRKFKFHTFAIDSERDKKGNVLDGIGGEVYPKLGFAAQPALLATGVMPKLVSGLMFSSPSDYEPTACSLF